MEDPDLSQQAIPLPPDAAFVMLADEWAAGVVGALADGPLRPAELEQRLPGIAHASLMRRLERFLHAPVALCERTRESARVRYRLSEAGHDMAQIVATAARVECERTGDLNLADGEQERPAGEQTSRMIAGSHTRAIARALAHGPLIAADIERRVPRAAHSSLARCLQDLQTGGAITARNEPSSGGALYELSSYGRCLARVMLLACDWQHRWGSADGDGRSDLAGVLHMIAPLARISPQLSGVCRLHVAGSSLDEPPVVDVAARTGKLSALPLAPADPPDASGRASVGEWIAALRAGDPAKIAIEGDRGLLSALVVALSQALRA